MAAKDRSILSPGSPGRIPAFSILLLLLFTQVNAQDRQRKKDSLWAVWNNTANADTSRLVAIGHLCSNYYWHTNTDSAIILADLEYDLAEKKKLANFMGVALLKKSGAFMYGKNYDKSLKYSLEALKIFKAIDHKSGIASSLNNIGQDYMNLGNYAESVHYFYEGLRHFEKLGNKKSQAQAYSNIGRAYQISGKVDSAIRMSKRALELCEDIHDKPGIAFLSADLCGLYTQISDTKNAFYYCDKAVELQDALNNKAGESGTYYNLAENYLYHSDYKQALYYLEKCFVLFKATGDKRGIAACHLMRSKIEKSRGNTDKAISEAKEGLAAINYESIGSLTYELASTLASLLEQKGNYKEALNMHKLATTEKDSSNVQSLKNALYQEELKYSFEKKELLAKAEHESALNVLKAEAERKDFRKNLMLTGAIALLFIIALSSYFIYHNFKQRSIIAEQKNNILKQQLLVSQMSPHFIFNSLNAVQNFIFKQDSYNAGVYLKQFSELIRMILEFSRKDLISLEEELHFLRSYLEMQKLRFDSKFNYELKIDPSLDNEMVMIPPMLAQPFIENAIEHGIFYKQGEGFLSIRISLRENKLEYEIEDNGIGLSESMKLKKGMNSKHKSLAISIAKERVAAMSHNLNSDLEIEINDKSLINKTDSGVHVKFSTPYHTL